MRILFFERLKQKAGAGRVIPVCVNGEISDDQEIVCRRMKQAGSRIPRKICGTKEQWAEWKKQKPVNKIVDGLFR